MTVVKEIVKSVFTDKHGKPVVYAQAYEEVEIISEHGDIFILRNKETKKCFPCHKNNITEVQFVHAKYREVKKEEKKKEIPLSAYNFNKFDNPIVVESKKMIVKAVETFEKNKNKKKINSQSTLF